MSPLPMRLYANVSIPSTPIVTQAIALAKAHLPAPLLNHSLRALLFGFIIASKTPSLRARDLEAHAVAAVLHDLGLARGGSVVSADRRFEVDGADAAKAFLKAEGGAEWDARRCGLVWDAIALHTSDSIARFKEPEVVATLLGVNADFGTPAFEEGALVTREEYDRVLSEVPRLNMRRGMRDAFCHLCRAKPETTFDNYVGDFGEKYVSGYQRGGVKTLDFVESDTIEERDATMEN